MHRRALLFRAVIAALALLAWLGASNHCGLQQLAFRAPCSHCASSGVPIGGKPLPSLAACCRDLQAELPGQATGVPPLPVSLVLVPWLEERVVVVSRLPGNVEAFFRVESPPPGFLLEQVLQRAWPALAPPACILA